MSNAEAYCLSAANLDQGRSNYHQFGLLFLKIERRSDSLTVVHEIGS